MDLAHGKDSAMNIFRKLESRHCDSVTKKQTVELDLLTKFRNYCKQRSLLDLEYGNSLRKLAEQTGVDEAQFSEVGFGDNRSLFALWNIYLQSVVGEARSRVKASEFFAEKAEATIKPLIQVKAEKTKRLIEHLHRLHAELQANIRDLEKCRKHYQSSRLFEEDLQHKLAQLKTKLEKKSTGLFRRLETLEREYEKLCMKLPSVERSTTEGRNQYLLQLAAATCHQKRYREIDLPLVVENLESDFYLEINDCLNSITAHTVACNQSLLAISKNMADESQMVLSPEEHRSRFYASEETIRHPICLGFEPAGFDNVKEIQPYKNELDLNSEARKWAVCVAQNQRLMDDAHVKLDQLIKLQTHANDVQKLLSPGSTATQNADLTAKIWDLHESCRKAETNKLTAEARLALLGGVPGLDVSSILTACLSDVASRSPTSFAISNSSPPSRSIYSNGKTSSGEKSKTMSSIAGSSTNGSPSFIPIASMDSDCSGSEKGSESFMSSTPALNAPCSMYSDGKPFEALFNYQAIADDELSFTAGDVLMLLEDPNVVQWPRARTQSGTSGVVPNNYIQPLQLLPAAKSLPNNLGASSPAGSVSSLLKSVLTSVENGGGAGAREGENTFLLADCTKLAVEKPGLGKSGSKVSLNSLNANGQMSLAILSPADVVCFCRASLAYAALSPDELSFEPGEAIAVTDKLPCGVDSGWYSGWNLSSYQSGTFPSCLVYEISQKDLQAGERVLFGFSGEVEVSKQQSPKAYSSSFK